MPTIATTPLPAAHLAISTSINDNALYRRKKAARRSEKRRISAEGLGVWTKVEHARFLEGKRLYPNGPWKLVAEFVGTRNTRQTMTHAQKFRQKLERRQRGLRTTRKVSEDEQLRTPGTYYTSSPRMGRASSPASSAAVAASPTAVDMGMPKVETVDVSVTAATRAPQNAAQYGSFEQLLKDNTVCVDASSSLEHMESYTLELPAWTATEDKLHVEEAGSPTHHGDAELPWLDEEYMDECLDLLLHDML
ncbi:Myb protein i [Globisporangium polare]